MKLISALTIVAKTAVSHAVMCVFKNCFENINFPVINPALSP